MISELRFSNSYSSFWRTSLPFGDSYVRELNVNLSSFATSREKFFESNRYAIISDMGFRAFTYCQENNISYLLWDDDTKNLLTEISTVSWEYIKALRRNDTVLPKLKESEQREGVEFANRMIGYFRSREISVDIITNPTFRGCGIVDQCFGDVIAGNTLYEIKSVDRFFRLVDVKQLLTYCALNSYSKQYKLDNICLINPRSGRFFRASLEEVALRTSGGTASELFSVIIDFISTDYFSE